MSHPSTLAPVLRTVQVYGLRPTRNAFKNWVVTWVKIMEMESVLATRVTQEPQTETEIFEAPGEAQSAPQGWLTLETLLYVAVLIVALALRLWNLGRYPLADTEAAQSLTALDLYRGNAVEGGNYSPLLVSLNWFIFLLFHSSDATARLSAVLLGSGLVLLPLTLRRRLGPMVCLLASSLLAISPTATFLSRTLNSQIAVALGALMMVSGFFNWTLDGRQNRLYLLAGGVAVLLAAGPMAYSILVVFAVIALVRWPIFRSLWVQGLDFAAQASAPAESRADAPVTPNNESGKETAPTLPPSLQQAGLFLLVALILLATAATFNLSGLGVATNLFTDWLSRFSLQAQPNAGFNAVFLLTIYEPLLVVAGLVGLAYAILDASPLRLTMVGWFIGMLILDLVMGGRPNGNVILSLVPLAFLAALALAELVDRLQTRATWSNEGTILASGLIIAVFSYIGLTGWIACTAEEEICRLVWLQAAAGPPLFLIIATFFGFAAGDAGVALRGVAVTGVALGVLAALSIGWRLNHGPLMNLGYQPLAGVPASTELVLLRDTLAEESVMRVGDKRLLDITLVGSTGSALQWQLRNYENLERAGSIAQAPATRAVITPVPAENDPELGLEEAYIGQDFAVNQVWSPVGMSIKDLVEWLIYREVDLRPDSNKVVLWLRAGGR